MTLEKETSIYQLGAIAADIERSIDIAASKNSIFHQPTAPPTSGRKVGDIWYDSDDGYAMYKFDGTAWVREQFGTNAISAGSITAARLDAQDVYTNFLRVNFLAAAQAEIESLSAITANLGSVNVGGVNNEDGVITIKDANNQTIGYWNNTGINAQAGTIGGWNVGTNTLESSGVINNTTYSAVMQNMTGTDLNRRAFFVHVTPSGTPDYYPFYVKYDGTVGMNTCYVSRAIFFQSFNDSALLVNSYGNATYNLIRNHNNGNISVSASGAGLYLGYENTTIVDFFRGQASIDSAGTIATKGSIYVGANKANPYSDVGTWVGNNGNITLVLDSTSGVGGGIYFGYKGVNTYSAGIRLGGAGAIEVLGNLVASKSSGQAGVYASNGGTGNRIFIYADASNGQAGLYSYSADNINRAILIRANNSNDITAYGVWTFNRGVKDYVLTSGGMPIACVTSNGNRLGQMSAYSSTSISVYMQNGTSGSGYARSTIAVSSSDKRMKKNIEDCNVLALPLINTIRMRQFDWISNDEHQNIGFIADELESIDSKLAVGGGYDEENRMIVKSVDTFYLLGYAIKAIQELSAEVSRLKGAA